MTKITQIEDRGATTAWSPIASYPDVIAVGAKDSGGIGFEDTGGGLELYDLNLSGSSSGPDGVQPMLRGSIKTQSRFASLGWSPGDGSLARHFGMGLLAGGMENGTVHVWNPCSVLDKQSDPLVASVKQHASGPVKALQFNTLNPIQLATGGSDGKVLVTNLDTTSLDNPTVFTPCEDYSQRTQITSVAWNTQVAHIVASSAADGTVAVWDLKSRKAWCELRGETAGQAVADMAWNPTQGLHLLTASADDRNPVLKIWDLRASTSMPLATLPGHHQGIMSIAWCPHDEHLLLSCGKDNRTILWDLYTLKPIAEVPNDVLATTHDSASGGQDAMFAAGGLASSQQRRYDVQWSPLKRGVASTCSLDRKVQAHSILGLSTKSGRPPKWLRPSSSVSCGFGGSVVSCGAADKIVRFRTVVEQPQLAEASGDFEATISSSNIIDFCREKAAKAGTSFERQTWGFMQVIFETNARQQLLDHLGYDHASIAEAASSYTEHAANGVSSLTLEDSPTPKMSKAAEEMVQKALLVGNFEAAVECCFRTGNLADALVLASCGGADLWAKTQERYFQSESQKRPFLSVVSAIIHSQLEDLVSKSDPKRWQETLAILSTYGKSDEFPRLCIALGDLLETSGDASSASLCYMCSLSLERSVKFWRTQLETANKKKGSLDLLALHDFVVKVSVFLQAVGPSEVLDPQDSESFSHYAEKLAEQGLFVTAAKYSRGDSVKSKVLRDRLYRSRSSPRCLAAMGGSPPEFPFHLSDVKQNRSQASQSIRQNGTQRSYAGSGGPQSSNYAQQSGTHLDYSQQQAYQSHEAYNSSTSTSSYSQQQHTSATSTQGAGSEDSLPAGWIALQDPSSGNTYYANQSTGEVTWEKPMESPIPATHAVASQQQAAAQQTTQPVASTAADPASTPSRLASKYGDGFVSSASHPELASQYGNVGTSNPYTNTSRPGTAAVSQAPAKAPVSGTFDPTRIPELSAEHTPIKECFLNLVSSLKSTQLSSVDNRQLSEAEKGVAVLLKRLARSDIPADVVAKTLSMTDALNARDLRSAQSVQTGLVNTDWREHKDWLKGIKALLQLAGKKL